MGIETKIEWCDSTINPTTGCEGCELWNGRDVRHCYAGKLHEARLAKSLPNLYAADFQDVRLVPGRMMQAARWADLRGKERPGKPWLSGQPRCIFVGDMGDFCSKAVPEQYIIEEIFGAIASPEGQRHFWLLLTKQIARLAELSRKLDGLPDNCMAMTTITDQHTANVRLPLLMSVECHWRGVSAEPLLSAVDVGDHLGCGLIHQVIAGGESGAKARLMQADWARSLRDACASSGVKFFMKQMTRREPIPEDLFIREVPR